MSPDAHARAPAEATRPHHARHVLRAGLVIAAVSGATAFGTWHEMEDVLGLGVDAYSRLARPVDGSNVALVRITNDDYRDVFGGESPLNPTRLQALIDAVGAAKPRVIGVDLDTSHPRFADLRPPAGVPVVWAHTDTGACAGREKCMVGRLLPQPIRSGAVPDSLAGIALLERTSGGVLRLYQRRIAGVANAETFGTRVARVAGFSAPSGDSRARLIPYRTTRWGWELPASEALRVGSEPWWRERSPLRDKVVLIGGAYDAYPDFHDTPLGRLPGVDVWAHVVAGELNGGGARPPARPAVALLAFLEGIAIMLLFHWVGIRRGVLVALAGVPVVILASSFITTGSLAFWPYFVPVVVAVLLLQVYEQVVEHRNRALVRVIAPQHERSHSSS
jgi:hypothetical protein